LPYIPGAKWVGAVFGREARINKLSSAPGLQLRMGLCDNAEVSL